MVTKGDSLEDEREGWLLWPSAHGQGTIEPQADSQKEMHSARLPPQREQGRGVTGAPTCTLGTPQATEKVLQIQIHS